MKLIITMKYLIVTDEKSPFYTFLFEPENHWIENCNMIVFDLSKHIYMIDGKNWIETKEDHL